MKYLPSISIVIATYDGCAKTLEKCLKIIRSQNYPQKSIEIILGDGGPRYQSAKIGQNYKVKSIKIPHKIQNAEFNRGSALAAAKNELVLILDHDNFFPNKNWIQDAVAPFETYPRLVAAQSYKYYYDRSLSLLDRYFALFGASEPLPVYLKKSDKLQQHITSWNLGGSIVFENDRYYIISFPNNPRKFLTIGSNGCLIRKNLLLKYADIRPDHHYPIDVIVDIVSHGYDQFAFIKNAIIHQTGYSGFWSFLKRRYKFVVDYHFKQHSNRRYSVVMPGDEINVIRFAIYSMTLIGPVFHSLVGFWHIHDVAWFLHVPMCIFTTIIYAIPTVKSWLKLKS